MYEMAVVTVCIEKMQTEKETIETHREAVNFVRYIFGNLGGIVFPPRRPQHIPKYTLLTRDRDYF